MKLSTEYFILIGNYIVSLKYHSTSIFGICIVVCDFEVRHLRCVGSITKHFFYYTCSRTHPYFI